MGSSEVLNPSILANDHRAWITVDSNGWARARTAAGQRATAGASLGPLDGISIGVKDSIDVAGLGSTHGSAAFLDSPVATADAEVVAQLRAAGVAIVGKTHMTALACGTSGLNTHFGAATNPHDPTRHPGGSSSGSAIAVATGQVPLALGSDTAGSIRVPAACCGLVGHKPTFGRVSNQGMSVCSQLLDHIGPIARDVSLACRALNVMQRRWWPAIQLEDNDTLPVPMIKVGVLIGDFIDRCEPSVAAAFEAAIEVVSSLGCDVVELDLGVDLDEATSHANRLSRDLYDMFGANIDMSKRQQMDQEVVSWLDLYARVTDDQYAEALAHQNFIKTRVASAQARAGVHVMICPTMRSAPCTLAEAPSQPRHLRTGNTELFNITGQPSLTVPVGYADAMPFGLQLSASLGDDVTVLRLGAAIEAAVS